MSTEAQTSPDAGGAAVAAAWADFTAALGPLAEHLSVDHLELDELDRAEGLRFLGRLTRLGLGALDPTDSPDRPRFTAFGPPEVTFGIPNPDNLYQRCSVNPALDYRITGSRGSVHFLSLGAQAPAEAAIPGTRSHLEANDLLLDADGSFEILVSASPQAGNWIEMRPDARSIMVRQTFLRRDLEAAAELHIECLSPAPAHEPLTAEAAVSALRSAADRVGMLAAFWPDWVGGFADHADRNSFFVFDEATHLALGGDPQVRTPLCRWRITADEALVVRLEPPECAYWNVQLATIWTEPIEPVTGRSCLNAAEVQLDEDGSVELVIAATDPGRPNWLDTGGHHQGLTSVRWVNATSLPMPSTRLVALDDLP